MREELKDRLPGTRIYHLSWARPSTRVFGRRLLSTRVYPQRRMLLRIFTELVQLPLSWNPDTESHLLCLQPLLLLPSSEAPSRSLSPRNGRLCLSAVPHTYSTSCLYDVCAGLCAPSHQTLAHTLYWVCRKCRPCAGGKKGNAVMLQGGLLL